MNANSFASNSLPVGAIFQENPIAPQMAIIPAGTYTMGTPESVFTRDDELDWWIGKETQRQVIVAAPLAVGRFPVTRGEFRAFVKAWADQEEGFRLRAVRGCSWLNPGFDQDDTHPVVCVSWHDAVAYVAWLSDLTRSHYRLLSESEWEYACRTGTQTKYWWGRLISTDEANYKETNPQRGVWRKATVPVDSFRPNHWGLSQTIGNVCEWCSDPWQLEWSVVSGRQAEEWNLDGDDASRRAVRGGSWQDSLPLTAKREAQFADWRSNTIGFRVARTLEDPAMFWRKVTSGEFSFWRSAWDAAAIPRPPGVSYSSLQLTCIINRIGTIGTDDFGRALDDLTEAIATRVKRHGIGEGYYTHGGQYEADDYHHREYRLPDDPELSVTWLYMILTYLSAARRALEYRSAPEYPLIGKPAKWDVKLGDKPVPWDQSTRSFGFPV